MAIQIEQNGEAVYRSAIKNISHPALISLLEWMADEEVKHEKFFSEMKQEYETLSKNPFVEEMSRELFNDLLGDQSFSLKEIDFSQIQRAEELIDVFIEFEKDSILFYEMLQPFIQDTDTRVQLNTIIAEEKQHIEQLQEVLESETFPTQRGK